MKNQEEKLEMYQLVLKALDEHAAHHTPSPETLKRFVEQDERMDKLYESMNLHLESEEKYRREELQPLIDTWKQYTGFGVVSQRVFSGTIKFLLGVSVFIGSLYGLKEWIKK